jgi:hypothetical protein
MCVCVCVCVCVRSRARMCGELESPGLNLCGRAAASRHHMLRTIAGHRHRSAPSIATPAPRRWCTPLAATGSASYGARAQALLAACGAPAATSTAGQAAMWGCGPVSREHFTFRKYLIQTRMHQLMVHVVIAPGSPAKALNAPVVTRTQARPTANANTVRNACVFESYYFL